MIFDLGITFEVTRNIIYTKYFPKEILDKYQSDGLIVTCIDTGSMAEKIGVQLLDQIILINGKKQESYKNTCHLPLATCTKGAGGRGGSLK